MGWTPLSRPWDVSPDDSKRRRRVLGCFVAEGTAGLVTVCVLGQGWLPGARTRSQGWFSIPFCGQAGVGPLRQWCLKHGGPLAPFPRARTGEQLSTPSQTGVNREVRRGQDPAGRSPPLQGTGSGPPACGPLTPQGTTPVIREPHNVPGGCHIFLLCRMECLHTCSLTEFAGLPEDIGDGCILWMDAASPRGAKLLS